MPAPRRQTTVVSTKGQMILPKSVRDRLGWGPGTRLTVEDTDRGVTLTPASPFPPTTLDEVIGSAGYKGPSRSIEEMDAGVLAEARRQWLADD